MMMTVANAEFAQKRGGEREMDGGPASTGEEGISSIFRSV